ncbi:hypothetical protein JQX08_14470 [Pseudomonas sp. UL073]|uniref:Uncharacterized protein n=1 Tax=Zestomonas insulae TaxID=2809017 RepID=A0ABS2IIX1_9GAMM|nr:hypothetical protein [Pseudomonas insulae]MBM7061912.1 hypothetical protein [Pseudomonas insulae]
MASPHKFLVSYTIKDQAHSTEVLSEAESLTPDQALFHLQGLHGDCLPGDITVVEVKPISHPGKPEPLAEPNVQL